MLVLVTNMAFSQEDVENPMQREEPNAVLSEEIPNFSPSFQGAFKLPNAIANNSFKKVFNGVSNVELVYSHPFLNNFFVGGGIQHSFYDMNKFSFPEITHGNLQTYLGFGEIGYRKFMTYRWYYWLSLRAGFSHVQIQCENCNDIGQPNQDVLYYEGMAGIYLRGNDRMSYGLILSYELYNFAFGPSWICRPTISGLGEQDFTGISQSFTVGFGFSCVLGKLP